MLGDAARVRGGGAVIREPMPGRGGGAKVRGIWLTLDCLSFYRKIDTASELLISARERRHGLVVQRSMRSLGPRVQMDEMGSTAPNPTLAQVPDDGLLVLERNDADTLHGRRGWGFLHVCCITNPDHASFL